MGDETFEPLMHSQEPLSRGNIVAQAGVPNDVMTFWVREGLIRPLEAPGGSGRHLRFAFYEANLAALMVKLREYGLDIEALRSIAKIYRDAIEWASTYNLTPDQAVTINRLNQVVMEHTVKYKKPGVDLITNANVYTDTVLADEVDRLKEGVQGRFKLTDELIEIASTMARGSGLAPCFAFAEITAQPMNDGGVGYSTYFWRTPNGWKRSINRIVAAGDGAFVQLAVNAMLIFGTVWNRP